MILMANVILSASIGIAWLLLSILISLMLRQAGWALAPRIAVIVLGFWAMLFRFESALWAVGHRYIATFHDTAEALVTNLFTLLTLIILMGFFYISYRENSGNPCN